MKNELLILTTNIHEYQVLSNTIEMFKIEIYISFYIINNSFRGNILTIFYIAFIITNLPYYPFSTNTLSK